MDYLGMRPTRDGIVNSTFPGYVVFFFTEGYVLPLNPTQIDDGEPKPNNLLSFLMG